MTTFLLVFISEGFCVTQNLHQIWLYFSLAILSFVIGISFINCWMGEERILFSPKGVKKGIQNLVMKVRKEWWSEKRGNRVEWRQFFQQECGWKEPLDKDKWEILERELLTYEHCTTVLLLRGPAGTLGTGAQALTYQRGQRNKWVAANKAHGLCVSPFFVAVTE